MIKAHIVYPIFSDWKFKVSRSEGSYIWDEKGRRLIDFTSGWNVTNLGWNNQEVNTAVIDQLRKDAYVSGWNSIDIQEEYAEALVKSLPKTLDTVCRATGGTEANEEALKIAWAATKRKKIISFHDFYHGHSFAIMHLGYPEKMLKKIGPYVSEFIRLDFPSMIFSSNDGSHLLSEFCEKLETLLKSRDIAALITESGINTGWGSTIIAPSGFLNAVRKLTEKYGTLLILDEVGTGFSRCGQLYGMELSGVVPDIVTFAKGISNGAMPIGAAVTRKDLAEKMIKMTNIYSTFGWIPPACAAALTTLNIHKRDKVWEKAREDGKYLLAKLKKSLSTHPHVGSIRGIGMEIGVTFIQNKKLHKPNDFLAKKIAERAFKKGLNLVFGGDGNIQIMPPLTIPRKLLDQGLELFIETVNHTNSEGNLF